MDNKDKYFILVLVLIGNFILAYSTFKGHYPEIYSYPFNYEFMSQLIYQSGVIITLFYIFSGIWDNKILYAISCIFMILLLFRIWNYLMIQNVFGFIVDLGFFIFLSWFLLPNIIVNIAKFLTEKGKYDYSIKLCNFCTNYLGGYYQSYLINGHNFIETEEYEKAIFNLEKCLTYEPNSHGKSVIYAQLGAIYLNKEEYEKSLCYYENACETELDEVLAYAVRGKILSLIGLGRYGEANDFIEENLKEYEDDEDFLRIKEMLKEHLEEENKD